MLKGGTREKSFALVDIRLLHFFNYKDSMFFWFVCPNVSILFAQTSFFGLAPQERQQNVHRFNKSTFFCLNFYSGSFKVLFTF